MNKQKKVVMVAAIAAAVIFVIFFAKKNTTVSLPAKEEAKPEQDPFYLGYNQPPIAGVSVGGSAVYGGTTTIGGISVEGSPTYNQFDYNYVTMPNNPPPAPPQNKCSGSGSMGFSPAAMVFNVQRVMKTLPDYVSEYVSPPIQSLTPPKPVSISLPSFDDYYSQAPLLRESNA